MLLSTLGFASQILIIDNISNDINPFLLSAIQFGIVAILSAFPTFVAEQPTLSGTLNGMPYLVFAGVLSSGIAYSLQNFGQKFSPSALASLVLSLESVFAALTGLLFMNEVLNSKEYIGCILIFSAIIISQISISKKKKS